MKRELRKQTAINLKDQIFLLKIDQDKYDVRSEQCNERSMGLWEKISEIKEQIKRLNTSDNWTKEWSARHVSINFIKIECKEFVNLLEEMGKYDIVTTHDERKNVKILDTLLPRLQKFKRNL